MVFVLDGSIIICFILILWKSEDKEMYWRRNQLLKFKLDGEDIGSGMYVLPSKRRRLVIGARLSLRLVF